MVVLSLAWYPADRVRSYVEDLVKAGVDVDLVVAEARSTQRVEIDPRVRVRNLVEARLPLRRVESILVYTLPGKIPGKVYRLVRPLMLSRKAKAVLADLDLGSVDRIVAADKSAVPLGWRLARRYPNVRATTALDRKPYVGNPDAT